MSGEAVSMNRGPNVDPNILRFLYLLVVFGNANLYN